MASNCNQPESVAQVARHLLRYCAKSNWAGYDPYDALNSRIFQALPLRHFKWARLGVTQILKRSVFNLRPLLLVPTRHNPKGLALFLASLVRLRRADIVQGEKQIRYVADLLLGLRTEGCDQWCWGYSFDWQTRSKLVPRGSPNIICTTFAANALLDAYEVLGISDYRHAAVSAARFVRDVLYCEEGQIGWFNYTPLEQLQIHNANLLGAALLSRVAATVGDEGFLLPALRATRFSVSKQNQDGSWFYGERVQPSQRWIDNFHTGFNLCALRAVGQYAATKEFDASLQHGLEYYVSHFFERDGAPKYFNNRTYPIDVHSVAQSVITLADLEGFRPDNRGLAFSVFAWAQRNMWDKRGFYYYQKHRYWTNRIPYIRWSQAWMLLALAYLLPESSSIAVESTHGSVCK